MIATGAVLIILAALALRHNRVSFWEILGEPFNVLAGSQRQLNATLLDVSENNEPFSAAGRRLFKPFGRLQLLQTFDSRAEKPAKKPGKLPSD